MFSSNKEIQHENLRLEKRVSELVKLVSTQKEQLKELDQTAKRLVKKDLELLEANEKLRNLDRLKSEFISVAAHQLRTPVSAVKWMFKAILDGDAGPLTDKERDLLTKGYQSNQYTITLINTILDVDRIGAGRVTYDLVSTQIIGFIDAIVSELLPQTTKRGIDLIFKRPKRSLPLVDIDPKKMRIVFHNVLENAIEYTPKGGSVTVTSKEINDYIQIVIQDTGIGIPKAQQDDIFKRFFRGTNAIKVKTEGSGLGLFIAKEIVEKHSGRIWFESGENQGTTLYFTIPTTK